MSRTGALTIPDRDVLNVSSIFSQPPDRDTLEASSSNLEHTDDSFDLDFTERMLCMTSSASVGHTTHNRPNELTTTIPRRTTPLILRSIPCH